VALQAGPCVEEAYVTPIKQGTAKKLGLRQPKHALAAFGAVISDHVEQIKSEWGPELVALFEAERAAAAALEASRREAMNRLQRRTAERAETLRPGFETALRAASRL
jgi:hypothetical protein